MSILGYRRGSVSEMLLVVGSLLASIVIVIAAWQIINYQTAFAQAGKLEGVARDVSKNINFVQQISNPYTLKYAVSQSSNLSIKNGLVRASTANSSASFPYIGFAENSELMVLESQFICISNNAETSGIPSVRAC